MVLSVARQSSSESGYEASNRDSRLVAKAPSSEIAITATGGLVAYWILVQRVVVCLDYADSIAWAEPTGANRGCLVWG